MSLKYKYVLFCEDIRQEIGGKVSLMGVLGSKLLTQQFPIGFPKLCLFIEWEDLVGKANIAVNILPPEGTDIPNIRPTAQISGQPGIVARSMIILNNFIFPKPGNYAFEFEAEGKVVGRENFVVEEYKGPMGTIN